MIDSVELSIPARADLLQLVRLTAGIVAARAELGLDDVEDLRLGVEELCLSLVGPTGDAPGRLVLSYRWDDEKVEVTCTLQSDHSGSRGGAGQSGDVEAGTERESGNQDERARRDLSAQILEALVDEHGENSGEAGPSAWLRMRRIRPADA